MNGAIPITTVVGNIQPLSLKTLKPVFPVPYDYKDRLCDFWQKRVRIGADIDPPGIRSVRQSRL